MTFTTAAPKLAPRPSIWRSLPILLFARTVLDTGFRAVYQFLPFIAAGLGVTPASAAQIVQFRNLLGFASPLFGPLTDRYGRRVMLLIGISISAFCGLAMYFVVSLPMAVLVFGLMAFSTILYVPAQQAFLGDNVPYAQRGRVMAIAEFAWSLAAILGLPLIGILVHSQGWRAGFVAIGLAALFALALLWFVLPKEEHTPRRVARALRGSYGQALRAPMALAVLGTLFLAAAANENVYIVFGTWMNTSFGLDALALGLIGSAIGLAEFSSQASVALFVDRVGKWKMVGGALVCGALAYLLLPLLAADAFMATAGLLLVFFMFELALVAALPLMTEIAPNARATLLSLGVAGFSLGRATGSFVGPALYANFGFGAVSLVSAGAVLVACVVWFLKVREKKTEVTTV